MAARCLDLDDEAATDVAIAGAKAAGLAEARQAGLPALPGIVIPVAESIGAVARAKAALDNGGAPGARLAVITVEPDAELIAELQGRLEPIAQPLIVRSSSPLEADGTWSGAFSTFHGIRTKELRTAIRGCWGSAFASATLDRAQQTDTPVDQLGLAVLVQSELKLDIGGIARWAADGSVRVAASTGPLHPLMAGHVEGQSAFIASDDMVETATLDHGVMRDVAALMRQVQALLGHTLIEWAAVGSSVHLLQSIRSSEPPSRSASAFEVNPQLGSATALRIAAVSRRFSGQLADELILPWAVATRTLPRLPDEPGGDDAVAALAAARALANQLTEVTWDGSPRSAASRADRVLRQLRSGDDGDALRVIERLASPAHDSVDKIMRCLATVRNAVLRSGSVKEDAAFWRLTPTEVDQALQGESVPARSRFGVDRWEPFVHSAVTAAGEPYWGTSAVPGAGAGRLHLADEGGASPAGRYVLVASEASPSLAPLLWNAAGLVTRAGSTAAHLIEFANSIGVPTVVGCDLPQVHATDATLIAVDGGTGRVSLATVARQ